MKIDDFLVESKFGDILRGLFVEPEMSVSNIEQNMRDFDGVKLSGALRHFKEKYGIWEGEHKLRDFLYRHPRIASLPKRVADVVVDRLMATAIGSTSDYQPAARARSSKLELSRLRGNVA
jgi:hypothetical protein